MTPYQILYTHLPPHYLDHHESDLYVRKDGVSDNVLRRTDFRQAIAPLAHPEVFLSGGVLWYDFALLYDPFWNARAGFHTCPGCARPTYVPTSFRSGSDEYIEPADIPPEAEPGGAFDADDPRGDFVGCLECQNDRPKHDETRRRMVDGEIRHA